MPNEHENEETHPEICAPAEQWLTENRNTRSSRDALGRQAEPCSVQETIGSH